MIPSDYISVGTEPYEPYEHNDSIYPVCRKMGILPKTCIWHGLIAAIDRESDGNDEDQNRLLEFLLAHQNS